MTAHSDGGWCRWFYDHMAVAEATHLRGTLMQLGREMSCPRPEGSNRGRPTVGSKEKLYLPACGWW